MKSLLVLCSILLSSYAFAQQDILKMLSEDVPDCNKLDYNAMKRIPKYYEANQIDSALIVFKTWDANCPNYFVLSFKILLALENDTLNRINDIIGDLKFINWYSGYHNLKNSGEGRSDGSPYYKPNYYFQHPAAHPPEKAYWALIATRARAQISRFNKGSWEQLMAQFLAYNQEPLVIALKTNSTLLPSVVRENYAEEKKENKRAAKAEWALYGDYWIPQNNLSILGNHPGVGLRIGGGKSYWRLNGSLQVNFLESANLYTVKDGDSTYTDDNFVSFFIGAQAEGILFSNTKNEWSLSTGIGYRAIEAAPNSAPEEETSNALYLNSVDFNVGTQFRYYYSGTGFLALEGLYHFHNFTNGIDDSLFGNAISVKLIWGFSGRADGNSNLQNLELR